MMNIGLIEIEELLLKIHNKTLQFENNNSKSYFNEVRVDFDSRTIIFKSNHDVLRSDVIKESFIMEDEIHIILVFKTYNNEEFKIQYIKTENLT